MMSSLGVLIMMIITPSGRGRRPPTDIDGRGGALQSGDGRGCGGLAGAGGGDGRAGDGGRRRADRRCSAAGGAVRSQAAGAAARRTAAPAWERRCAAGDRLLRRGMQHLRRGLAQERCRVCVGVRPEPALTRGDRIAMHLDNPSQRRKSR